MSNSTNPTIISEEKKYYLLIKKVFAILAPFYDFLTFPISGIRDKVANSADARFGAKILDVATGTGGQAFAFAKKGYQVVGVDLSEAMLKVAQRKNKYENVRFETADAANIPFEGGHFDVSCISFALHDMPAGVRGKVLKEIRRVTKPNGIIIIVDYGLPESGIGRALVYNLVKLYEGKYYREFIKSDLAGFLTMAGIEIKEELSVLLGVCKILKCQSIGG
ncbi:MAG: class I SAM-dependent methyltransferase [Candidatus Omnitrophota bacterium]